MGLPGLWQEVHMVVHEHIAVQLAIVVVEGFFQPVQVALVTFNAQEAGFSVVGALDDVERDVIELDARAAGHSWKIAQNNRR
jgi:hypothetical protein